MAAHTGRQPIPQGQAFDLGRLLSTPGALRKLNGLGVPAIDLIARHAAGDWGDLDEHDRKANEEALQTGARLLSAYEVGGVKFWVITEADRSATTVLLPEEY
jgi:hypothetical protein